MEYLPRRLGGPRTLAVSEPGSPAAGSAANDRAPEMHEFLV